MKIYLYTLVFLAFCFHIQAQNAKIKGRIVETKNEKALPVEAVSVSLLTADSAFVGGCTTDGKGVFLLDKLENGNYIVSASFVGYETVSVVVNNLSGTIDLGDIMMGESSIELGNVEVTASNIVNRVDRQVILPVKSAVDVSVDAYDLMNNLNIPRLYVNPIMKTMEVSNGGSIQTRINGIKVSANELATILPKDVLRIEFIEDPGSRYGEPGLGAVVNIVTRRRETGGYVSVQGTDSPYRLWGENFLTAKFNNRRSEWGLNVVNRNRGYKHRYKNVKEEYHFADRTIERVQEGLDDKGKNFTNDK